MGDDGAGIAQQSIDLLSLADERGSQNIQW